MKIGGIDEAGRGPVIGPLVIAGISIEENKIEKLATFVKDSKMLSAKKREEIFPLILSLCDKVEVEIIPPKEVDRWIKLYKGGLNKLELKFFAKIADRLEADIIYVDPCDVNPSRFAERIKQRIIRKITIISELDADKKYPSVSAASIIAKVTRDKEIKKLKELYGDIGSGYPSDPKTIAFLRDFYRKHGYFPDIVRKSYKTIMRIVNEVNRRSLL